MAAFFNRKYGRPLSVVLGQDFAALMKRHGGRAAPGFAEGTALALRGLDALVLRPVRPPLLEGNKDADPRPFQLHRPLLLDDRTKRVSTKMLILFDAPDFLSARSENDPLARLTETRYTRSGGGEE